jgi:hypothetical protein
MPDPYTIMQAGPARAGLTTITARDLVAEPKPGSFQVRVQRFVFCGLPLPEST